MKKAIVSCGIGGRYPGLLLRQVQKCQEFCPQYKHLFWLNCYPPNSRTHDESRYGFKVHAIREAINQGYEQVFWMDSAIYPIAPIERMWEETKKIGVFSGKDGSLLSDCSFPKVLKYFGREYEEVRNKGLTICGGSFYCFDFNHPKTMKVFEEFEQAEKDGMFGSVWDERNTPRDDKFKGTRHDEVVLAYILDKYNIELVPGTCSIFDPDPFINSDGDPNYTGPRRC
jgi:hypothetical protein